MLSLTAAGGGVGGGGMGPPRARGGGVRVRAAVSRRHSRYHCRHHSRRCHYYRCTVYYTVLRRTIRLVEPSVWRSALRRIVALEALRMSQPCSWASAGPHVIDVMCVR